MAMPIDRQMVDRLVVQHLPAALRLATRLANDPNVAEDVVQEALCRVLKRWKTFRGQSSFKTWMMQIVVNVDRDRRRRTRILEAATDTLASSDSSPGEDVAATELSETIRNVIQQLPDRQREVAVLGFGEAMRPKEIASVLEMNEANVHTCLHLARKKIAEAIGPRYLQEK